MSIIIVSQVCWTSGAFAEFLEAWYLCRGVEKRLWCMFESCLCIFFPYSSFLLLVTLENFSDTWWEECLASFSVGLIKAGCLTKLDLSQQRVWIWSLVRNTAKGCKRRENMHTESEKCLSVVSMVVVTHHSRGYWWVLYRILRTQNHTGNIRLTFTRRDLKRLATRAREVGVLAGWTLLRA